MTMWRLELLRLWRTHRWLGLLASYLVFGIGMPVLTRYQDALFEGAGGEITVIVPPPTPPDGITAYVSQVSQLGLLVSVVIAAAALAFDARPEWSAFLRTRATPAAIVLPKFAVNAAAVAVSFVLGALAAWLGTVVLLGAVPWTGMLAGIAYGALYLTFAVAVVVLAAGVVRSTIGTAAVALAVLIAIPIAGTVVDPIERWLPSHLLGSLTALASGDEASGFLRAAVVTVLAGAVAVWVGIALAARREA